MPHRRRRRIGFGAGLGIPALMLALLSSATATAITEAPSLELDDQIPELRQQAVDYAESLPTFAGTYTDRSKEAPFLVFLFTNIDPLRDQAIRSLLPIELGDEAVIRIVDHTMSELRDAKDSISQTMSAQTAIQGVGIDVINNQLVVVSAATQGDVDAELLWFDLSIPVAFLAGGNTTDSCSSRDSCGGTSSRRAGVRVTQSTSTSSGLSVTKSSNGTRYSTTAAHFRYGVTSGPVTSGGQSYGSLNSYTYLFSGSFCDCRLITASYVANRIYYSDSDPFHAVTSKRTHSYVGDTVRLTGIKKQSNGVVKIVDYDYITTPACGCLMRASTLADYSSEEGDSGGAITSTGGGVAVGMHSGRSAGYGRYFDVDNMQAQMGVTILISS